MADQKTSIVITAEDKTQAALASVRSGFAGLTQSLGGLGSAAGQIGALAGALGGLSVVGFAKTAIDMADNLGKLSQKLGIAVEDLAGFQHAADLSDLTLDQFAQGVKQLSRYMGDNSEKLKAAGITATDAKGALIQLADAFAQMQDGPQKTAIAMEVLGKAGAEMIPLLNGGGAALRAMMEEGQRLNPVTAEMAKRAEEFNDNLTRIKASAGGVGIVIANELLPPLTALSERLVQAFSGGLVEGFTSRWGAAFKGLVAGMNETLAASEEFLAKITFGRVAENHLRQALQYRDAAKSIYRELSALAPADAKAAPGAPAGRTNLGSLLGSSNKKGNKDKKDRPFDPEGDFFAAVNENLFQAGKKAADEAAAATDKYDESIKKAAQSLYKATDAGAFDAMLDSLAQAEEAFARGFIDQDQLDAITGNLMDVNDKLKETKSIGEELGLTFTSAFEDAIVGGKKFSEVLQGLLQDILRLVTRKNITEPLAEGIGSIDWGGLLKFNADGGVYSGPGISAYSGQVVSRPTVFPFASGIGLMGEAGPEAILPLKRGANGKLGVDGGGGSMVVNIIEAPGRGGQQQTRNEGSTRILDVFVDRIKSSIAQDIGDGRGVIPSALSNSYGLNRAAGAY